MGVIEIVLVRNKLSKILERGREKEKSYKRNRRWGYFLPRKRNKTFRLTNMVS